LRYDKRNVYRDQSVSGNKSWKDRQIGTIIDKCKEGDHIVVSELSRLSRRAQDLHNIVALCNDKGIKIHCIKDGFRNDGTMTSIVMLGMLSTMSQLEREFAVARSKSAIETMKRKGIKMGAPNSSELDDHKDSIELDLNEGKLSISEIAEKYNSTYGRLYKYAQRRNFIGKKAPANKFIEVPEKVNKRSKYDPYIEQINKELKTKNLKEIAVLYDFNYSSFSRWYRARR
jgi:DNA invertase Pin-like site-specific DNA recombinase